MFSSFPFFLHTTVPTGMVQNVATSSDSNSIRLTWNRPPLATLNGKLSHYNIVYNRTLLSGVAFNLTTATVTTSAGSETDTAFSHDITGLSAGSKFVVSVEPCRGSPSASNLCGPASVHTIDTANER